MRSARVAMLVLAFGCGSSDPMPLLPGGGPAFLINSPADGSSVAGVTWFAIQPENVDEVAGVHFKAGDEDLGTDTTPADGFKVFLVARDHPGGTLRLEATVTGKDGKTATSSIAVTNVPDPPSSTTVSAAGGAVLGTLESDGSISTLTIAPGDAAGAAVTFNARTKEDVKTATGVDYDALGVTFLGAQETTTTRPFEKPLGVSSGGFGPRVQPGQVVVQYRIAPDADGDGKGELVVVNTASVAPNGDVISDPIPQVMVQQEDTTISGGRLKPSHSPTMGPPGTILEFHVFGFNPNSFNGNRATWTCADGRTFTVPGVVFRDRLSANPAAQLFQTIIPGCPAGPAMVTLTNLSTGASVGPFTVTVTIPSAVSNIPATMTGFFTRAQQGVNNLPSDVGPLTGPALDRTQQGFERALLPAQDYMLPEAEIAAAAPEPMLPAEPTAGPANARCFTEEAHQSLRQLWLKVINMALRTIPPDGGPNEVHDTLDNLAGALANLLKVLPWCEQPEPCVPSTAPGGTSRFTGMGSAPPPGGSGCGSATAPSAPVPPGPSGARRLQPVPFEDNQPGRVVVRIFVDGQSVPFAGATDAGGYFFIPFIPEGRDFTAIAYDTMTGQSRSLDGVGPPFGKSVSLFFDFFSEQPGNVSGTVRDAGGAPVAGVRVRAVRPTDALLAIGQATTDVTGRYRLPKLPAGAYLVESRALNHTRATQSITVADVGEVEANLTVIALPVIQPATVYVLSTGNAGADEAIMEILRVGGHQPTLGVGFNAWDGTQVDLSSFDVVVLPKSFNFNRGPMLESGSSAVEAYAAAGGGVVTGELLVYTLHISHPSANPLLKAIVPVTTGGQFGQTTETTYSRENPDPIIDRDVPATFTFSVIRHFTNATETKLALKTGAVSFYHSSQVDAPGLVGWSYGQGRVISLSTLMTGIELSTFAYQQLVINAVSWAARRGE